MPKRTMAAPGQPGNRGTSSNIIEEMQQQVAEKDLLLSLNSDIATIHNKRGILDKILPRLKQLFNTEDIFLCRINHSQNTIEPFLRTGSQERLAHNDYQQMLNGHFAKDDRFFSDLLNNNEPRILAVNDMCKWPSVPAYAYLAKNAGIKSSISIAVRNDESAVGIITLWSSNKNNFTGRHTGLLQKVAAQMSIVLNNIADGERIQQWQEENRVLLKEKDILINLGRQLGAVRSKEELLPILKKLFEELPFYADLSIAKVDSNGKTFSRFLNNEGAPRHEDPGYPEMREAHHSFPDGVFEQALYASAPVMFDMSEIMETGNPPSYIRFLHKTGTVEMAGIPLRNGNKAIGVLFLFSQKKIKFQQTQMNLVAGITNMLGTTIANILANEEILRQLQEIQAYKEQLEGEKSYLQEEIRENYSHSEIIGRGVEMQVLFHQLMQVANSNSTVLLLGETGTGKELVARAIHNASNRKDKLMVRINCAALPSTLIESELFGHEKGSFTGALHRKIGKFELANEGTLFLDEIGEMPLDMQVKILRAIQEKEIDRIGGKDPIKINVRIIAATNRDLQKEVDEGRFRHDLFYRLNVFPIHLPPLRQRKDDIPLLAAHFVDKFARNTGKNIRHISDKVMKELVAYNWPGNVRELEHLLERMVLMTNTTTLREIHLPSTKPKSSPVKTDVQGLPRTFEENERDHIIRVLNQCNGKVYGPGGAASILNLPVSTLNSKIKKLGIKKNKLYR